MAMSTHRRPHGVDTDFFLHPDQASIRGSSPRRTPSDRSLWAGTNGARESDDKNEAYSIGNLSIEPKPSITSISSNKGDPGKSLRSVRSFKSLGFKSSEDSLQSIILKPRVEYRPARDRLIIGEDDTPPESPESDYLFVSDREALNNLSSEPASIPKPASSTQSIVSPRSLNCNAKNVHRNTNTRHNVPSEDYIPKRDSSIRHSHGVIPSRHKRVSQPSEHSGDTPGTSISLFVTKSEGLELIVQENPDRSGEDLVSRRIKELKEQKVRRERDSMDSTSEIISAPQTPDRSALPPPAFVSHQPVTVISPIVEPRAQAIDIKEVDLVEDTETSAPSPAIAQRVNRSTESRAISVGSSPAIVRDPPISSWENTRRPSTILPQRSSSRLLKRLSRSASPTTAENHGRASSKTFGQPQRNTVHQPDNRDLVGNAVDDYLQSPRLSQTISHPQTGRVISFSEVGDPGGSVVFCCLGMGLTRFITAFYDELASTLKLRLLTPDRPGIGGSEAHTDGLDTPLSWPDDVRAICQQLRITKFSVLAHSAGAIYALATALRMPQHIRCRIHLLAPWIPPSQMTTIGAQQEPVPTSSLPYSQRFLRTLPTTFLRAANSSFLSATSASFTTSLPKSPGRLKRRSLRRSGTAPPSFQSTPKEDIGDLPNSLKLSNSGMHEGVSEDQPPDGRGPSPISGRPVSQGLTETERRSDYDARLTEAIWDAATTGANPTVDLLVCLERRQPIGFRYVDITRAVVMHHGNKDTRVPVENIQWLGKLMRRCEVRVLEGEGHGLMASASVMGNVLMEMAAEWDDWNRIVRGKEGTDRRVTNGVA